MGVLWHNNCVKWRCQLIKLFSPRTRYLENKMIRIRHTLLTIGTLAALSAFSEVQAQFFRPSTITRVVPQNRSSFGTQNRVYANNGVQYQSYRPSYGQTTVYSNGRYTVQPNGYYTPGAASTYYAQPTTSYYYDSNGYRVNSGSQVYSDGSYAVQPNGSYTQSAPTYYAQPATQYYYDSNGYRIDSGNQVYSSQPANSYSSNYGTGFYNSPQQAASANAGARIGNAIGGSQGAQIGAAIGSAIRP